MTQTRVTRPRSTDDPKPDDTVESESKKARRDRDETAENPVAKSTAALHRLEERCSGLVRRIPSNFTGERQDT